eukprot:TRINITY_DN4246_c0_g1_i1.p2 TRINITY_DN4246_c0_g1~~TRINITY_DN4246_c0_g1_i1.p2  ORF type:complete len:223 (-),score=65.14 TRINITY_DN4246_c0_g1_i1:88-756(-)
MSFDKIASAADLAALNAHLATRSYISGYQPTAADAAAFAAVGAHAHSLVTDYANVTRWFAHIKSFTAEERAAFAAPAGAAAPAAAAPAAAAPAKKEEDEIDLFGDDDEEDEEYKKDLEKKKKEAEAKKGGKKVIGKSNILLDVKPWDDTTDMVEMEKLVRTIEMEGLLWGGAKLVPVGYGIKKLQINCVVVDELVSVDELEERITAFEDHVQSIDIAAFNKI